jgi:hypothetical protein
MKLNVVFLKSPKHFSQMVHMSSWSHAKNNDVINVAFGETNTHQHLIHDLLKFCKGIFKTKLQKLPLVQTILPMGVNSSKCCFELINVSHTNLVLASSLNF